MKILDSLCLHGTLAQEPLAELKIVIQDINIERDPELSNYFELSNMIQQAFLACLSDGTPVLLEPIYDVMLTTPEQHIGTVSSLIAQFQGRILKITQDEWRAKIHAKMSVRASILFAQEIRGKTAGRVFWQNMFDRFSPVPAHEKDTIIQDIKFRKGLAFF